jgi:peptidyl-prolyl cis-trans isomerase D
VFDLVTKYKRVIQVFLGLIAITFATWGIESYTRFQGGRDAVAVVNGIEISQREFAEELRRQQEQLRRMFGGSIDPALLDSPESRRTVLDAMVAQRLLMSEAGRAHMIMSREAVIEAITSAPDFQENGAFSPAKYSAYLSSRGISDQRNVAELQTQIPLARFAGSIAETAIAPRTVAVRIAQLEAQKREVSEVRIPVQPFLAKVKIDDAQLKAHYDANQADYRTPERVRVEYVVLSA